MTSAPAPDPAGWRVGNTWRESRRILPYTLPVAVAFGILVGVTLSIAVGTRSDLPFVVAAAVAVAVPVVRVARWRRGLGSTEIEAGPDTLVVRVRGDDQVVMAWSELARIEVVSPHIPSDSLLHVFERHGGFGRLALIRRDEGSTVTEVELLVTRPDTDQALVDFLWEQAWPRGVTLERLESCRRGSGSGSRP